MKKFIFIVLLLSMLTLCLYSCDGNSDQISDNGSGAVSHSESTAEQSHGTESQVSETSDIPFQKRNIYYISSNDARIRKTGTDERYGMPSTDIERTEKELQEMRNGIWGIAELPEIVTVNWWGKEYVLSRAEKYFDDGNFIDSATADYMLANGKNVLYATLDMKTLEPVLVAQRPRDIDTVIEDLKLSNEGPISEQANRVKAVLSGFYSDISFDDYEMTVEMTYMKRYTFTKKVGDVCVDKIEVNLRNNVVFYITRFSAKNGIESLPEIHQDDYVEKATALLEEIYGNRANEETISDVSVVGESINTRFSYSLNEYIIEYSVKYTVTENGISNEHSARFAIPYADKDGNAL